MTRSPDDVAVVVPVHNEEAPLGRCVAALDRAAGQVDVPVMAVVVLDGCTDRSAVLATLPFAQRNLTTHRLHNELDDALGRARSAAYADDDFVIDVWSGRRLCLWSKSRLIGGWEASPVSLEFLRQAAANDESRKVWVYVRCPHVAHSVRRHG